ncbi:MAG: sodium:solute symporter family protein [Verrucomicrobiales bacterium]|nr:sodium:solute symporter family protein [Verrucomicrobiales bacterium]
MEASPTLISNFSTLDWWIVGVYLVGTVIIGLYANRYIKNMADYVVAGRSLKSLISVATMLGSEIGLVTVMYTAQKGFTNGFAAFHIGLVAGLTCFLVGVTGFIVVPLRRSGVMTIPEFYGQRFGQGVRVFGAIILAVAGILNMGVYLKAAGLFITSLTGMTDPAAVNLVMVILIALVLAYTILGGMVSVVITDYLQFIVLAFGMVFVCWMAVAKLGWDPLVQTVQQLHGTAGFDPLDGGGFGPSYVLWMIFTFGLVSCAVWPTAVMRVCAAKDIGVVKRLYKWSAIGFMTRFILPQFLGICALCWFWQQDGADSRFFDTAGGIAASSDETLRAMPLFLSQILPVGVIGLVAAGMLAAFMSTHDSYLLCWAAIIVEDIIAPLKGGKLSTKTRLTLARWFIFLTGLFLLAWSIFYPMEQDMLDYLAVSGAIYFTGAFAVLVFGLYWKRASRAGAVAALCAGIFALAGLTPLRKALHLTQEDLGVNLTEAHIGLITTSLSVLAMVVFSLLMPDREPRETAKPNLEVA